MGTSYLNLFFIIAMIFTTADLRISEEEGGGCWNTPQQILHDTVIPQIYEIVLTVKPDEKFINGTTDITINVTEPLTRISLHARNLGVSPWCTGILTFFQFFSILNKLDSACVVNATYKLVDIIPCEQRDIVSLVFANAIPVGTYVLHIEHASDFDKNIGVINFPIHSTEDEGKWLITTMYVPNAIRALFPCWDDPSLTALFRLSIKYNETYTVYANTPVKGNTIIERDNLRMVNFKDIHRMSTTLFAIAIVSGMNEVESSKMQTFHYWKLGRWVLRDAYEMIKKIYDTFWDYGNRQFFVMEKIDHIALRNNSVKSAGKPGLIIYRQEDLSYNKNKNFPGQRIDIAKLIAHEISYQYFYDYRIIASDWWIRDILASYYSYFHLQEILGSENKDVLLVQALQTALDTDIYLEREPIIHKVKNDSGIDGLLYLRFYHKKAYLLIRMLSYLIKKERLKQSIKAYIDGRGFKDIWVTLQEEYSAQHKNKGTYTIKEIMYSWLQDIHHPELLCTRDYSNGTVECRQLSSKHNSKHKIPVIYATQTDINSLNISNINWFEGNSTTLISGLSDSVNFYILNLEQIGYYRVNYDKENWLAIAAHLSMNTATHIPDITRTQLISDAFYFATNGQLNTSTFYNIIKHLENEINFIVWYPIFNILSYTSTYLEYPERVGGLRTKLVNILGTLLDKLKYKQDPKDKDSTKALRLLAIKWACKLGHADCKNATADIVSKKISTDINYRMYKWEIKWIYPAGMMALNERDWQQYLDAIKSGVYEYTEYAEYLTYSMNDNIILRYLDWALAHDLVKREEIDIPKLYFSLMKKHARKHRVLKYVLDNYDRAVARYPDDFDNGTLILTQIIMNVYSGFQFDQVKDFIKSYKSSQLGKWTRYQYWINASKYRRDKVLEKFKMFSLRGSS